MSKSRATCRAHQLAKSQLPLRPQEIVFCVRTALTELSNCEALNALPGLQVPLHGGIKQAMNKTRIGRSRNTVCSAQVVLTQLEQQVSFTFQVQQLYLGSLFSGQLECKPVNSISKAVGMERTHTQKNLKYEACISPASGGGSLRHLSSPYPVSDPEV